MNLDSLFIPYIKTNSKWITDLNVRAKTIKLLTDKLDFIKIKNFCASKDTNRGFPGGAVVESLPANAGDTGSSPGLGRSHMPWSN